uniref:hypothetical protein n=1 Tax=Geobacillus sp. (strain Y412MC10) TaxID=481743 RepID=UPI0037CBC0E4
VEGIMIRGDVGMGAFGVGMGREEVEGSLEGLGDWRGNDGIGGNGRYIEMVFRGEDLNRMRIVG